MIPFARSSHYQLSGEAHFSLIEMRFELIVSNVTQFWIVHHRSISFTIWRQESNLSPLHLRRTSSGSANIRYINPDSNYLTRPDRFAFSIIDCFPTGHRFRCASRNITALWSTSYSNWYVQLFTDSSNVLPTLFPTAVVTAAFVDLFCDPKLFISPLSSNVPRNHRIIFIITFFLGGIVGAGIIKTVGWGYVLIVAGIIKLVVAGSILFLDGAKEINEEGEKSVGKAKELKEDEDDFHSPTKRTNEGVIGSTRPLTEIMFADGELTRINSRVSMESIKTIVV